MTTLLSTFSVLQRTQVIVINTNRQNAANDDYGHTRQLLYATRDGKEHFFSEIYVFQTKDGKITKIGNIIIPKKHSTSVSL